MTVSDLRNWQKIDPDRPSCTGKYPCRQSMFLNLWLTKVHLAQKSP